MLRALGRQHHDRGEREAVTIRTEPETLALQPAEADAAAQRRGQVVGVPLERQPELEQLVRAELAARDGAGRDEPDGDTRRRGAEPALERDAVDEVEAVPLRAVRDQREGAQREVLGAAWELLGALAFERDRHLPFLAGGDLELFQSSSAAAAQSKPGPRQALEAGAATLITA